MTYGHAERNLAFIRQLEAETRQLMVRSAVGRVPSSDKQLQGGDEVSPAFSRAVPDLDRGGRHDGHDELPQGLVREPAIAEAADQRHATRHRDGAGWPAITTLFYWRAALSTAADAHLRAANMG